MEVCQRWHRLYGGTMLTQKYENGEELDKVALQAVKIKLDLWRLQLASISWFMRALNEPLARIANTEDKCTGAFWESRFRSQALLDEKALLACMAYVDLNPIRAKMASSPETSEHTSIKKRIEELKSTEKQPLNLADFVGNPREPMPMGLPFRLQDYIELVDWTGRCLREDKRGAINASLPSILDRLKFDQKTWANLTKNFESQFTFFVGGVDKVKAAAKVMKYKRTPSLRFCREVFG